MVSWLLVLGRFYSLTFALAVIESAKGENIDPMAKSSVSAIHAILQITHKSPIPDPKRSDYEDCLFTVEAKVLDITSEQHVPRNIIILLPAFTHRIVQPEAAFTEGQLIEADFIPLENVDKRVRTQQRSDDVTSFDLEVFYCLHAEASKREIASIPQHPDSYFQSAVAKKAQSVEPIRYPWSEKAAAERKAAIERDKATILQALNSHGGNWDIWQSKLQAFYKDLMAKKGKEGSMTQGPFFFERLHYEKYMELCAQADTDRPGPLRMLKALNLQLRQRGIDLIVVPYPLKEEVHADVFSEKAPSDGWFIPYRQKFLLQLLEADVEVIDLVPALQAARSRFSYIFYDHHDNHPASGGVEVGAEEIVRRLGRYDMKIPEGSSPIKLHIKPVILEKGVIINEHKDEETHHYPANSVVTEDGKPLDLPLNPASPMVIMGDSYTRTPEYLKNGLGAALPMHVAYRFGVMPDVLESMGSSNKAMQLLAREGQNYLKGRRVLIFVFAPNRLCGQDAGKDGESWNLVDLPPISLDR